jgi:hypothetical protein
MPSRFIVPGRPPSFNDFEAARGQVRHRRSKKTGRVERFSHEYNDLKNTWTERVALLATLVPRVVEDDPVLVFLRVYDSDRRRDPDNVLSGARKVVHDGLQAAGIVKNDSRRYILPVNLGVVDCDPKNPRTEVAVYRPHEPELFRVLELVNSL